MYLYISGVLDWVCESKLKQVNKTVTRRMIQDVLVIRCRSGNVTLYHRQSGRRIISTRQRCIKLCANVVDRALNVIGYG